MPRSSVPSSDGDNSLLISPEQNKELINIEYILLSPINKIVKEELKKEVSVSNKLDLNNFIDKYKNIV